MKRALLLVVTMCMVSLFASAQAPAARSAQANPDETAIRQIEQDWVNAVVKADTAALDRIWAADYVFTDYEGQIHTKAQMFADLKSGAVKAESETISEMKVRILGDVAIVHGMDTWKAPGWARTPAASTAGQMSLPSAAGAGRPWPPMKARSRSPDRQESEPRA